MQNCYLTVIYYLTTGENILRVYRTLREYSPRELCGPAVLSEMKGEGNLGVLAKVLWLPIKVGINELFC